MLIFAACAHVPAPFWGGSVLEPANANKKRTLGLILIFLASVFWSLNAPLVKGINVEDPFLLSGLRAGIACIALAPFIRIRRIKWNINTLLMFIAYTGECACIVLALRMTSTAIAVGMQFTAPVWLYLWERKKGEKPTLRRLWPLIVLLAGTVVFMCSTAEGVTLAGNLIALSTSLWFAAVTYFSKKISNDNPLGVVSLSNLFCAIVVLPLSGNFIGGIAAIPGGQWPWLIALGVLQIGGGYGCYYTGLKYVSAQTAAMISPLEMVLGPLWAVLFLGDAIPDTLSLIAFALVLAGAVGEVLVTRWPDGQKELPVVENAATKAVEQVQDAPEKR